MATGTLYGCPISFRTQQILIAAKFGGSKVTLASNFKSGECEHGTEFLKKFPFGKSPAFESSDGRRLFETNAISTYVGGNLCAKDAASFAEVQQWMTIAEVEIYPAVAGWVFPSVSVMQHNKQAVDDAKDHLLAFLASFNDYLLPRTYLVGERISLADIAVFMHLSLAFQHVLEPSIREKLVNVTRWFETLVNQPEFKSVIGEFRLCEKAAQFDAKKFKEQQQHVPHAAPEPGKKQKDAPDSAHPPASAGAGGAKPKAAAVPKEEKTAKKESGKKAPAAAEQAVNGQEAAAAASAAVEEMDAAEEALAMEPKKADPFDALPKGTFNMDEFKRTYSNNDTIAVALPYFWQHFDKQNFSIWFCEYKFPQELTMVYMSCNLISGMFQRLDKMRKNAFGSMCLFGTDNNSTISGVWVWRGHELAFELSDDWKTDYESYTWRKVDANSNEAQTLIREYFAWEGQFGGKKFNQGKIFK
jgi:elongation factor 1-gamma